MKTETKFTRSDYMEKRCTHRQYYAQFVTAAKDRVRRAFTIDRLRAAFAKDEHFNSIPLGEWDGLASGLPLYGIKEAGDYCTPAGQVCALKEAARQLVEEEAQ